MTKGRLASVLSAAALAAIALPAASSGQVVASPPSDPLGDVSGAPDVTNVAMLHLAGALTFTVTVANELVLSNGSVVELRFDTDMNPSTGSGSGAELLVQRLWTGATRKCIWSVSSFSCASSPDVTSTYVEGFLVVTTTVQALGLGTLFDLSVAGYNAPNVDFAPDSGSWRESLAAPQPALCPGIACLAAGPRGNVLFPVFGG